jgi:subtilisin family serine protease
MKVLGNDGNGYWEWIVAGLNHVMSSMPRPAVVSMSLSGEGTSQLQVDAIDALVDGGVAVVVAAGNNNADACNYVPETSRRRSP